MIQQFLNRCTKKVIVCTNCGMRTRVPIKMGKVLLVTCPSCQHKFEIQFDNPKQAVKGSIEKLLKQTQLNPKSSQVKRWLPWVFAGVILLMLKSCFLSPSQQLYSPEYNAQKQQQVYQKPDTIQL